jgi:CheY-like chemotaxis protein
MVRVLAADDDDAVRRVLARWLELWGYEAAVARDGHEAWAILKRSDAPRIVILDWDMPGLSGVQLCRMLRAMPHGDEIYVLVLTAKSHKDELIEAAMNGVRECRGTTDHHPPYFMLWTRALR